MRIPVRPDGPRLVWTILGLSAAGLLLLGGLFLGTQVITGQLNMADITHRLPKPMARMFVEDPDQAMVLGCDGLDETDPDAITRFAAERDLDVEFVGDGADRGRLVRVDWLFWHDRLIAFGADAAVPAPDTGGTACPG